jgi:NADPH:quinone reductase-like Zn-dependent oxidoreductase
MKSVTIRQFGEPADVVEVIDRPIPEPGPGQVRVRMLAAPVNPSDLMSIRGVYTKVPPLPFAPGYEGVGVVESTGPGLLGRLLVGRHVALLTSDGGTWQNQTLAPARQAVPLSSAIPVDQAAMFFVNPTTAFVLTRRVLAVPAGHWLLQTAAGSALGKMVIRLSQRYGFRTINVVRRQEQADELKALGADTVIATDREDVVEQVKSITKGVGVHHALDCVGGTLGSMVVKTLAPGGRLVVFGTMSAQPLSFSSRDLMTPSASIQGFWLGNYMTSLSLPAKLSLVSTVGKLIRGGVLTSEIGQRFPLDAIRDAVQEAERPARGGKVLLTIDPAR